MAKLGERRRTSIWYRTRNKSESNNRVSLELVILLSSTNQRIQPGLTRGQESARRPPAWVHNSAISIKTSLRSAKYSVMFSVNVFKEAVS